MTATSPAASRDDAIAREIIANRLLAIADEMGIVLARASMSPVIYEVLDFACGLTDAEGQLVAQSNGITVFTGMFSDQVQFLRRKFAGRIRDGDVFIMNDPYEGGTHTADVCICKPVFSGGEVLAYAVAVAHWSEVGGKVLGSLSPDSREIFEEGIRLPGLKLFDGGVRQDAVFEMLAANVRLPRMSQGDLNAELAAVRIADDRLAETCAKYGADVVRATFAELQEKSAAVSRAAIAALPDGTYEATDVIDGDGLVDEPIHVQVKVTVRGEAMEIDFTGSAAQRAAPINCSRSGLGSAVRAVFKAFAGPHQPSNEGWFAPLTITVPDGTVFSAQKPAATGWYFESTAHAAELVWKALAPLVPERFSAGSYASLCGTYIAGHNDKTGDTFVHLEPQHGGWGAGQSADGTGGLIALMDGDTYNHSLELVEAKTPLRIRQYGLDVEQGAGAGRHRGGFGLVREFEVTGAGTFLYASYGRSQTPAWGQDGGEDGGTNYIELIRGQDVRRITRTPTIPLEPGDRIRIHTGGGGGWGDPKARDPEAVLADVRNGYLTAAQARAAYSVAIRGNAVDAEATAALRGAA